MIYTFDKNGKLHEESIPAVPVDNIIDSTGCGDAFAGGLAFGLLTTNDYNKAAQYANALGAQSLQGIDFEGFKSLTQTQQTIHNTYEQN